MKKKIVHFILLTALSPLITTPIIYAESSSTENYSQSESHENSTESDPTLSIEEATETVRTVRPGPIQNIPAETIVKYGFDTPLQFSFSDSITGIKSIKIINPEILADYGFITPEGTEKYFGPINYDPQGAAFYPRQGSLPFKIQSFKTGVAEILIHVEDGANNIGLYTYRFTFTEPTAIPFDTIRVSNLDLSPGVEVVVVEGVTGYVDQFENVLIEKVDRIIEYGPDEIPFDSIRNPNLDLEPGVEVVITEGTVGRVDEDGNILIEKVDRVVEYGPDEIPFNSIRNPNPNLEPGVEIVITEGTVGRIDEDGNILVEKVDRVVEYGPKKEVTPSNPDHSSKTQLPKTGEIKVKNLSLLIMLLFTLGISMSFIDKKIK